MKRLIVRPLNAVCLALIGSALLPTAFAQQPSAVSGDAGSPTEIGEINGASFRIDMPAKWNQVLVITNHGYNPNPVVHRPGPLRGLGRTLFEEGYAIAQSGYAAGGWAIEQAVTDNESLRRYFIRKHGQPKETYVTGGAMGAYVAMTMLEMFPSAYDGGLSSSGPLASYRINSFDTRILFDYYFPGVMPPLEETPKDFQYRGENERKIREALDTKPDKAEILRRYSGMKTLDNLAHRISFNTFTLRELQLRSGGNPFDNRGMVYMVDDDLAAVNAGVRRYAADPKALDYMRKWGSPTGKLERPLVAINPVYDPISDLSRVLPYQQLVFQQGCQDNFVQQFVTSEGHGNIPGDVQHRSFNQMRAWAQGGAPPPWGLVK